jgi:hypothetical protein
LTTVRYVDIAAALQPLQEFDSVTGSISFVLMTTRYWIQFNCDAGLFVHYRYGFFVSLIVPAYVNSSAGVAGEYAVGTNSVSDYQLYIEMTILHSC